MPALRSAVVLFAAVVGAACTSTSITSPKSPCDLATAEEVRALIGSDPVSISPDLIGEESTSYCLWATSGRAREMKLEIWSAETLEAMLQTDPQSYFEKLWHDAGSVRQDWPGVGDGAFYAPYVSEDGVESAIEIVVRKGDQVLVFAGRNVKAKAALHFASELSTRI